ncbi:MAG: twin-arginine translocation pathway signal protein [Rhodocyclaceae bacterium]|nr:MAG: twin-arginine translocation pathway signal protein [Rhodocyclaceae bacterium]TND04183.1 MAG: twin-arginine translocation pathway signal protein [Rhodocyclaceae bacterium]
MRRRDFLVGVSAAGLLTACGSKAAPPLPPGTLSGASEALGHRLRKPDFPAPTETRRTTVAIVGGGIGGLSAAWKLARSGLDDFLLLEMESEAGGNSRAGGNEISAHPLGAHYLPLPPREARATRQLLAELGVLQGDPDAAHPSYDEKYLCHAPQERLYTNGYWQDGLWPTLGVPQAERAQYARFQNYVAELRQQRDSAGRRPFALPLALSSRDPTILALDRITLRDWLLREGYTAPGLHWLADYACRDDYGTAAAQTSAWAGLHYFACRDGEGQVLTAPEGNAWLARGLARATTGRVQPNALVFRVEQGRKESICDVYLAAENRSIRVVSRELIWAAPLFLIPHVFAAPRPEWLAGIRGAEYAPWIVANLTLSAAPQTRAGHPLAWDNVLHDSAALGYVVATHQQLRYAPGPTVITWYRALQEESASRQRQRGASLRELLQDRDSWAKEVLADLSRPHPEIRELTTRIDIHRHAHAMIRPLPGRLWSGARSSFELGRPGIQFAHADVSGLSLFEEANHRGVLAAERTLTRLGVSYASSL